MKKDFDFYKNTKPFKLFDLVVLGVILVLIVALLLVLFLPRDNGAMVQVYRSGKLVAEYDLNDAKDTPMVKSYGTLVLLIEGNGVTALESECPDKCCVKQGKISRDGESIICVPQEIVVKIVGGDKSEVEGITK